ncbi:MAG: hypothetical protein GYB31_07455 [Bacteroidetes bacterium]|nr:hypothetical protein [Bacteroidota bacterium]
MRIDDLSVAIDHLALLESLDQPENPVSVVEEIAQRMFPVEITENQKAILKDLLIPGLPDFEWTVEYTDWLSDPDNPTIIDSITARLVSLIRGMLRMSESQLS